MTYFLQVRRTVLLLKQTLLIIYQKHFDNIFNNNRL